MVKPEDLKNQWDRVAIAALVLLVFSFVFGGASRAHALRLALVELAALPLLVLALQDLLRRRNGGPAPAFFLALILGVAVVPLIQLIPLPPGVTTALPGRDSAELALQVTGIAGGWAPLSITPDFTWRAFLALIPPLAMALAAVAVQARFAPLLIRVMLATAAASIILGIAQFVTGSDVLYPWETTGRGSVSGLFANRNHLATLCLATLPFAAVLAGGAFRQQERGRAADGPLFWLCLAYIGLAVLAHGAILSRAGILLVGPVLAASLLAVWIASGRSRPGPVLLAVAGAGAAAVVALAVLGIDPILARFDQDIGADARLQAWPIITEAAQAWLPLGSGLGSFDTVFRSVEPVSTLGPLFFNQAHNDFLELWLETGWPGVALMAAFAIWFGRRAWSAWRAPAGEMHDLQRASSIAILMVLIHSAGDYPLRTETIAVLFALFCGILEFSRLSVPRLREPA